jgi:Na+/H+-dicarboxylate symporter
MAVLIGGVLLILDNKVAEIKKIAEQLTLVFMQIIESVCKLLPVYIFVISFFPAVFPALLLLSPPKRISVCRSA